MKQWKGNFFLMTDDYATSMMIDERNIETK